MPIESQIKEEMAEIGQIENPTDRALTMMLYLVRKQMFLDGNKRTSLPAVRSSRYSPRYSSWQQKYFLPVSYGILLPKQSPLSKSACPCPWGTGVQGDQRPFGTVLRDIGRNISKVYFVQVRICAILKGIWKYFFQYPLIPFQKVADLPAHPFSMGSGITA